MPRTAAKRSGTVPPAATRWLDGPEDATWRALAMVLVKLPWALESQLKRDAGLSFIEYHALARLSEDPHHTLRMSVLAELTHASLSRLSHLIKRLEARAAELRQLHEASERLLARLDTVS
jgi:DNA-binding MarR family transcriptional regulator